MEVVGTFASGLQIADFCARLTIGIYKLRSKLKHAPADIQRKADSVKQFSEIVLSLKSDFETPGPCPIRDLLPNDALSQLLDLLRKCGDEIIALDEMLQSVLLQAGENLLKRQGRNLRTLIGEDDVRHRLEYLQELVNRLGLWYNPQLLKLCSKHL